MVCPGGRGPGQLLLLATAQVSAPPLQHGFQRREQVKHLRIQAIMAGQATGGRQGQQIPPRQMNLAPLESAQVRRHT